MVFKHKCSRVTIIDLIYGVHLNLYYIFQKFIAHVHVATPTILLLTIVSYITSIATSIMSTAVFFHSLHLLLTANRVKWLIMYTCEDLIFDPPHGLICLNDQQWHFTFDKPNSTIHASSTVSHYSVIQSSKGLLSGKPNPLPTEWLNYGKLRARSHGDENVHLYSTDRSTSTHHWGVHGECTQANSRCVQMVKMRSCSSAARLSSIQKYLTQLFPLIHHPKHCSAKPKCSNCSLFKWEVTALWLCTAAGCCMHRKENGAHRSVSAPHVHVDPCIFSGNQDYLCCRVKTTESNRLLFN